MTIGDLMARALNSTGENNQHIAGISKVDS